MAYGLWIAASSNAAVGIGFLVLGLCFALQLPKQRADRMVILAFVSWWWLFALQSLLAALRAVMVEVGQTDADVHETIWIAENSISVFALWGLAVYVEYVVTGARRRWLMWGAFLFFLAAFYAGVVLYHDVIEVFAGDWGTGRRYATPPSTLERLVLVGAYYGLLMLLVIRLALVSRSTDDDTVRFRTIVLALGILLIALVGFTGLVVPEDDPLGPLSGSMRLLGLLVIWVAYFPPLIVRQAFGIRSWREQVQAHADAAS